MNINENNDLFIVGHFKAYRNHVIVYCESCRCVLSRSVSRRSASVQFLGTVAVPLLCVNSAEVVQRHKLPHKDPTVSHSLPLL